MTGSWYVTGEPEKEVFVPLSFPIPLAANVKTAHFFYGVGEESKDGPTFKEHCTESLSAFLNPTALKAGELCIYQASTVPGEVKPTFINLTTNSVTAGGNRAGGLLKIKLGSAAKAAPWGEATAVAFGTFAVKGCSTELPEGDPNKCP